MIDSFVPPESPHENTNGVKFVSIVLIFPPVLNVGSSLVVSPTRATTSLDSSLFPTSILSCKRPHPETLKKSVHFAPTASVRVIENAVEEWTVHERNAVWYSGGELHKQRRTAHQLADTMDFYSDDDLMDRFGVPSVQRQLDRRKEVRSIAECVILLNEAYGLKFWNSAPVVIVQQNANMKSGKSYCNFITSLRSSA